MLILEINDATKFDEGMYKFVVQNIGGEVSSGIVPLTEICWEEADSNISDRNLTEIVNGVADEQRVVEESNIAGEVPPTCRRTKDVTQKKRLSKDGNAEVNCRAFSPMCREFGRYG